MKTRITLTIEPEVSHRAKAVAHAMGTSLSGLVESLLVRETGLTDPSKKTSSFSEKWAGRLKPASLSDDGRFRYLKERYGI